MADNKNENGQLGDNGTYGAEADAPYDAPNGSIDSRYDAAQSGYDAQNAYAQGSAQNSYGQGNTNSAAQGSYGAQGSAQNVYAQGSYGPMPPQDYYAGGNPFLVVPPEIKKWNWGAFMFNWIWGIGNHAYMALVCLVPCFGFFWMFICGAKGNEWAWKSGEFRTVEIFLVAQRTWNRGGLVQFILWCFSIAIAIIYMIVWGALIIAFLQSLPNGDYYSGTFDYY